MTTQDDEPIFVEDDDDKADWIKALSWDLPDDLPGLLDQLAPGGTPRQQKAALSDLMALPAWQPAPDQLKLEAARFLAGN